jgi:hypothetical protein
MTITAEKPSKQWFRLKKEVLVEAGAIEEVSMSFISNDKRTGRDEKLIHAIAYISKYAESSITDTSPEENQQDTKYLVLSTLSNYCRRLRTFNIS